MENGDNRLERNKGVAVFKLDADSIVGPRAEGITSIKDGDVFVLGILPVKAIVHNMHVDITKGFPAGHTMDVARALVADGEVVSSEDLLVDISLDNAGVIKIPLPSLGNLNPDGTPYIGVSDNVMKTTKTNNYIIVTIHGADTTNGNVKIIAGYDYFDTRGTGVYLS